MDTKEIVEYIGGVLLILLTVIEITPIKFNPWSWMAKVIGKAINADVLKEIADVKDKQQKTAKKLEEHIQADDDRDANMHRQRILRFNSELMRGLNFTYEYYLDMLRDIDEYEMYCENHPNYKNNRAVMAIANIKRVYQEHEKNRDFLGGV